MQVTFKGWETGTPDNTTKPFPRSTDPPPYNPNGLATLEVELVTPVYVPYSETYITLTLHLIRTDEPHAHLMDRSGATATNLFIGIPVGWRKHLTITGIMDADATLLAFHPEPIAPSDLWDDYNGKRAHRAFFMEV